jgi:hypothetical protein
MSKKLLLLLLICVPLFSNSQIKIPKLFTKTSSGSLTYEQANDLKFAKQYKNNSIFDFYLTKDDVKIKIGDTLTIGNAFIKGANWKMFGRTYEAGDVFQSIYNGDIQGRDIENYDHLPYNQSGNKVIVHSIYVKHKEYTGYNPLKNKKETPLYINLFVKPAKDGILSSILGYPRITIVDLEEAFSNGEIINPNPPLTRSEAIRELKDSKDLLDLDMLTEEEYKKIKDKLIPIIHNQ